MLATGEGSEPSSTRVQDLFGRPGLHDAPAIQQHHPIRRRGRTRAMRDHQHGHRAPKSAQRFNDLAFRFGVEGRCRLIHEQDLRPSQKRLGDRQTLQLTAREGTTTPSQPRLKASFQAPR